MPKRTNKSKNAPKNNTKTPTKANKKTIQKPKDKKTKQTRKNGQYLRPEGFSDSETESFEVYGVDGVRCNNGNVSIIIIEDN